MVHSGFEASAVNDTVKHPLRALKVMLFGPETEAPMAADIPLENQRPAEYVFEKQVKGFVEEIHSHKAEEPRRAQAS